jgi:hypothetical protein
MILAWSPWKEGGGVWALAAEMLLAWKSIDAVRRRSQEGFNSINWTRKKLEVCLEVQNGTWARM